MNYDLQNYAYGHGLATTSQPHIQQHQLHQQPQHFQQPQQIFQQQYSQAVPTSNVYHFQLAGGGSPVNSILQQDSHTMAASGSIQPRMSQHSMATQPFVKQGLSAGIDSSSIHMIGSHDAVMFSQPKNSVKIRGNPDCRIMQQPERARMQQTLAGVDLMGTSSFVEQNLNSQLQQHPAAKGTGQSSTHIYSKHLTGWAQPQQAGGRGTAQQAAGFQSTLPSFGHVWSQFPRHKQADAQQQKVNQYQQQPQQFQNQHHHHHHQHTQAQQSTAPSLQSLPGIQTIKIQHEKPHQLPVQTVSHRQQRLNLFPHSESDIVFPDVLGKDVPAEGGISVTSQHAYSLSDAQVSSSCAEQHRPSTAVTYTVSGPPKVTVTLDSLTHNVTLSPKHLTGGAEASGNSTRISSKLSQDSSNKDPSGAVTPVPPESCHSRPQQEWQRNPCLSKHFMRTSLSISSQERSPSESSDISSPNICTPPSSIDSVFSPVPVGFLKPGMGSSNSAVPLSLPVISLPSSIVFSGSFWARSQSAATTVSIATAASSFSTSVCTSSASIVFGCSTVAITTTSVTSTTCSSKETTCVASVHSSLPLSSINSSVSETHSLSCSLACKPSAPLFDREVRRKVQVPYNWHRKCENGVVVYLSPSGVVLQSFDQICHYLLSDSTCKCGLECPIQVEKLFNFDPEVESQPWSASSENLGNLCNRRREILALAAFHSSQAEAAANSADQAVELGKKERRKSSSTGEVLIVSPPKRLKTSITNAVNKHAMSVGSTKLHLLPDVSQSSPALSTSISEALTGSRVGDILGQSCSTGNPSVGRLGPQKTQSCVEDSGKLLPDRSTREQDLGDCNASKQTIPLHQQGSDDRPSCFEKNGPEAFMPAGGNVMFHQRHGRESVTSVQKSYPTRVRLQDSMCQMQYTQSYQHHHHQQHQVNPGFFPAQNHVYLPDMSHESAQRSQKLHPTLWHDGISTSATHSPYNYSSRPYPQNSNFQLTNLTNPHSGNFLKHQQEFLGQPLMNLTKSKSKKPKSKKDKQPNSIVDRSSTFSKALTKTTKTIDIPSTSDLFFGNPIDFVEQQAAIINSSIASCQLGCQSPSPPKSNPSKSPVTCPSLKDATYENKVTMFKKDIQPCRKSSFEDHAKNGSIDKDDDEDQKTGTDLDSNKSFSDATENNDSAYLSQTGSDQERSDTVDGLDSHMETKSSEISYFSSPEEQARKQNIDIDAKSFGLNCSKGSLISKNPLKPAQRITTRVDQDPDAATKSQSSKKSVKSKLRQKTAPFEKDAHTDDVDLLEFDLSGSLNGDLANLLASDNWNIPALQQVLAQYSHGGLGQLNTAIQQINSQAVSGGADFPASNLLSAAARAQHNTRQKEQCSSSLPNGTSTPVLQSQKAENLSISNMSSISAGELKPDAASTFGGNIVSSLATQQQPHQIGNSRGLIGNKIEFQQLQTGNIAMSMLLPAIGQGSSVTSNSIHVGTCSSDAGLKTGQGTVNPAVAPGILATVSQTGDQGSQVKLSVVPSSFAATVTSCATADAVLFNNFGPRMIVNAPMPPVSVAVVTNVTKPLTQVVPTVGIKAAFCTQQITQQLLNTQQNGPQLINMVPAAAGAHIINTSQGGQSVTTFSQGGQSVTTLPQGGQSVTTLPQGGQSVTTLPQGGYSVTTLAQGGQSVTTLAQGGQSVTTLPQGGQPVTTLVQGGQSVTTLVQGGQPVTTLVQGGQPVTTLPQGGQSVTTLPQGGQSVTTLPLGGQPVTTLPQGGQPVTTSPQGGQPVTTLPQGGHSVTTSPQGGQSVTTPPQGSQLINPAAQSMKLVSSTPRTSQIMNTLPSLKNNQLLIANSVQQVSPSNNLPQLSPAVAAQILTQGHSQFQQISPSFLQNHIQKQNPVISVSNQTPANANSSTVVNTVPHISIQKNSQAADSPDKVDLANGVTQMKHADVSLASTSVYASANQPVFAIPQQSANPVMQVLGSSQPLGTTSLHSADLNVQQNNLPQAFGRPAAFDQFQNLVSTGFNPLAVQQLVNTVSVSGVQQQQQLQILQQLMLQQLQNQGQTVQGVSLSLSQSPGTSPATAPGAQTVMSAVMPQRSLRLSSVVDVGSLHPCPSPVAQVHQSHLPPASAQLQRISSSLAMQQMTTVNSCSAVGVIQGDMQSLMQATVRHPQKAHPLQSQLVSSDHETHGNQNPTLNPSKSPTHESLSLSTAQVQQQAVGNLKSPLTTTRPPQPSKPKSKSKSKKSESKKIVDPETERNEEDIAATVQQILAQAVQQQRELSLAAKNQPPPAPKSKSKKSRSRSKANQTFKEHELGKLTSISDDVVLPRSEDVKPIDKSTFEILPKCAGLVGSGHFDVQQSLAPPSSNCIVFPAAVGIRPHTVYSFSGLNSSSPGVTSFVEQALNETNFVNSGAKKSSLSLKDHLSSIISKDKDGNNKKMSQRASQIQVTGQCIVDTKVNHTAPFAAVLSGDAPSPPQMQRISIK